MNGYLNFLVEYWKNYREIGSVAPDSKICINSLLKNVPFDSTKIILEYGAAVGTVTVEIKKRLSSGTTLICIEKNPNFFKRLAKNVYGRNIFLINDDVFGWTERSAARYGIYNKNVDCIISTLPCSCIDFDILLQRSVLPLLKNDGIFIQYVHTVSYFKGFRLQPFLKKYFKEIKPDFVLSNVPPVIVYTCRNPKT